MSLAVANRYARALSDLVLSPSSGVPPQQALDQLRAFQQILDESSELRLELMSPAVAVTSKRAAIGKLADRLELSRVLRNFLFVIVDHRRIPLAGRIVEAFEKALDDRLGRVRATITSAAPLNEGQQRNIEAR